ncbi:hypothetical protein KCP73_02210 [Salmonella enterica subsp. enterica]|nr:hypothetical protein KCP73_02210 [Salmonella enterica subsp. enterica]
MNLCTQYVAGRITQQCHRRILGKRLSLKHDLFRKNAPAAGREVSRRTAISAIAVKLPSVVMPILYRTYKPLNTFTVAIFSACDGVAVVGSDVAIPQ